ncbi:unnamed protein product [Linum tenue]|uniref:Uncharacterized protein n=1 Tax=Linum tenue TaxID=586396 RepID=A0AAV0HTT9_9ROSI|nr:unnamed protein product [Linum tenue]
MATFQSYAGLISLLCITITIIKTLLGKSKRRGSLQGRLPPAPLALPIIGHLHLLAPIPHQALHKLAGRHGPLFRLSLGSVPCVVASSPETAREFLKTHDSVFSDRPVPAAVDYLTYGSADFFFAPYGPYWKFMKKLCVSELLGGRILDRMLPLRRDEIGRSLQRTRNRAEAGEPMDVGGELIRVANNVISVMAMGERCSGGADEADWVRKLVAETAELTGKFNLSDYVWFCKRLDLQGFGKRLEDLRERKEDQDSEIKLTRENIKAFIWDIFAAGTESSAITTEWAMAELINHPEILNRARKEIDSVVGKSRLVQESDIPDLPYLQAIVKETMMLHPAAPLIMRESSRDCEIQGYKIPARTRLFVNVWAIGRDPNLDQPN